MTPGSFPSGGHSTLRHHDCGEAPRRLQLMAVGIVIPILFVVVVLVLVFLVGLICCVNSPVMAKKETSLPRQG